MLKDRRITPIQSMGTLLRMVSARNLTRDMNGKLFDLILAAVPAEPGLPVHHH